MVQMWRRINANPGKRRVGDCVVRAIAVATGKSGLEGYDELHKVGRSLYDMPSANETWGLYLYLLGFDPFLLPESCPQCVTVKEFCRYFPRGRFIIGTGSHAVAVIDGDYYDTFDSGGLTPSYFFEVR